MAIEIERKFILHGSPPADRLGAGVRIRQGYLAENEPVEVRVRIADAAATLVLKAGTGLSRTEVELPISLAQAEALWPYTARRRIAKTRHRVVLDDDARLVAEVDVYGGALSGLCVVEVEFDSEEDAAAFVPPEWFGRELTGEVGWGNAALARDGRPD